MLSKECRLARREIDELELGQRAGQSLALHLSACAGCKEFRDERNALRQLVGSLEPVTAPADFEMRLRARIARESSHLPEPLFARLFRTPALAAIALFVVVGGAVVWVAQRNDQPTAPAVTHQQPSQAESTVTPGSTSGPTTPVATTGNDEVGTSGSVHLAANPPGKRIRPLRDRSEDYNVRGADPLRQNDQAFVDAPSKPVVFALEDERGTKRKIALPPVSFGAQNLVDNRVPVSYSPNSRVW